MLTAWSFVVLYVILSSINVQTHERIKFQTCKKTKKFLKGILKCRKIIYNVKLEIKIYSKYVYLTALTTKILQIRRLPD